jgi:hypothetical protein
VLDTATWDAVIYVTDETNRNAHNTEISIFHKNNSRPTIYYIYITISQFVVVIFPSGENNNDRDQPQPARPEPHRRREEEAIVDIVVLARLAGVAP